MRKCLVTVIVMAIWVSVAWAADDVAQCQARYNDVAREVDQYTADPMTKRILQADLTRAQRELLEGDADECVEALDHAAKLLSGQN